MTSKTFIRLMFVLIVATSGLLLFASSKTTDNKTQECPLSKEKQECNQAAKGDLMIWESLSRHLLTAIQ